MNPTLLKSPAFRQKVFAILSDINANYPEEVKDIAGRYATHLGCPIEEVDPLYTDDTDYVRWLVDNYFGVVAKTVLGIN